MNHAARIITSTTQERLEQYAHAAYGGAVQPDNETCFAVIPPGVNRRVFSPVPGPQDAAVQRRISAALERDIAEGRRQLPLVIASSRLESKKNHIGLVRAFALSEDLHTSANLAIVVRGLEDPLRQYQAMSPGERAIMDEITGLMQTHQLWGKVTAFPLNSQAELAAAYRYLAGRRSVFCLTALYEPFGLAPLEAMSCGLPAVVTRNGGPSESLQEDGHTFGILVDPGDPDDIARGLMQALGSEQAWKRLQEAGMQRVLSRYTWERTAEGYLGVIESMLQGPAGNGGLTIPEYFTDPTPDTDIPLSDLAALYFRYHGSLHNYETPPR
jgi:sucrose-phosphate synthase